MNDKKNKSVLSGILRQYHKHFRFTLLFSLISNLLLLALPIYTLQVFDRVFASQSMETLVMLAVITVFALGVMMALDMVRSKLLLAVGVMLDRELGPVVLGKVFQAAARENAAANAGVREIALLRQFLTGGAMQALLDAPWVPIFVALVFFFHPLLGLTAVVGALVLFALALLSEKFTRQPAANMNKEARGAAQFTDSIVRNAQVVYALGMITAVTGKWRKMNEKVMAEQIHSGVLAGWFANASKFARLLIQVAIYAVGAVLVIKGKITGGALVACTMILARALGPVETAVGNWKAYADAKDAYNRLDQVLSEVAGHEDRTPLPAPAGKLQADKLVYVRPGSDMAVIKGVSFTLEPGEALGIVGPSGSGKSTLARILAGVWPAASGAVRIDGAELSHWDAEALGKYLGYMPQEVEMLPGTVAENIARFGEANSEEIIAAAQLANVHELILSLPNGYDTLLGEAANQLAAGQRQRVALARALFGSARLVVLDEPNAFLDNEGEVALHRTLLELKKRGVTTIVISHRPNVINYVDKLLVLQDGAVAMFGPRAEVLARIAPPGAAAA